MNLILGNKYKNKMLELRLVKKSIILYKNVAHI